MSIDNSLFSTFETAGFKSVNGVFEINTSLKVASLNGIIKSTSGLFSVGATTSDLPEGTNLYWTYDRLKASILGSASVVVTPDDNLKTLTLTSIGLGGTVTSVSVVSANGISGTVATATTTPAITLTLGAITPTSVNGLTLSALATGFTIAGGTSSKTLTVPLDATVSGLNTGDQTITLSGDISGTGTGAITTAIGANKVLDTMIRQSAGLSIIGRSANTTGNVADISAGSDGDVLRRSGTVLGFGSIPESSVTNLVSDLAARVSTTLTSAHILIGNASNIATDTAVSGDISITNAGVTAIGANKVTLAMMATITTASILGRNTAGTGNVEVLTTLPNSIQDNITRLGTIAAGLTVGGNGASLTDIKINVGSTTTGRYIFQTGGVDRWHFRKDATPESGSNAGSNLKIDSYDDAGTLIDNVLLINRVAAGTFSINRPVSMSSTLLVTGAITGSLTGNASTATALQTARNINGVSFNGTADITVTAAAGTLTGTTLNSTVVTSSLTSIGTIGTGVWNGTIVTVPYGGTGVATLASNGILYGNGTGVIQALAVNSTATNKFLTQVSSGSPAWSTLVVGDLPTITLSGDVSGSGSGGTIASIAIGNNKVTLAMMATMATASVLGRTTAGTGNVEVLSTTGTGNVVFSASPTLTGTITAAALTLSTTLAVTGTSAFTGAVGIGGNSTISSCLFIRNTSGTSSGVDQFGIRCDPMFTSAATTTMTGIRVLITADAASYTTTDVFCIKVTTPVKGVGSTWTNLYGLKIENIGAGGTLNYSIFTGSGIVSLGDTTDSTSITTGGLQVAGGIGVAKRLCLDGSSGKTLKIVNGVSNATVAVTLGSTGPTGSTAGAPQGWMRIDIAGTDRYIPFW